jgi:hypothetical protein
LVDPISQFFNDYNGILSVIAILVGIIIFFYQQHSDKKQKEKELHDMIRQFCQTILNDIKEIRKHITVAGHTKVNWEPKKIEYTQVFISTNVYQSVLHSGVFTHFETDTQLNLDMLYYIIEGVNDNHKRLLDARISHRKDPESIFHEIFEEIECSVTKYQKEILTLLDKCEINIKHELERIDP